jgi:hypothetical protein
MWPPLSSPLAETLPWWTNLQAGSCLVLVASWGVGDLCPERPSRRPGGFYADYPALVRCEANIETLRCVAPSNGGYAERPGGMAAVCRVGCTRLILMAAPSAADRGGTAGVGRKLANAEETSSGSTPSRTSVRVASTCTPAPYPAASSVWPARSDGTAI